MDCGWYAVSGTVTIDQPITVNGEVHLILTNGCTLTAEKGIVVTSTNSLTIYAQSENGGTLNATGTTDDSGNASAGIGGSTDSLNSGAITIHGGVINATGGSTGSNGYGGAGIGGGTSKSANGGNSGTIIIYGGTVTANNGARGNPWRGYWWRWRGRWRRRQQYHHLWRQRHSGVHWHTIWRCGHWRWFRPQKRRCRQQYPNLWRHNKRHRRRQRCRDWRRWQQCH